VAQGFTQVLRFFANHQKKLFQKDGKFAILKKKGDTIRYSISEFSSTKSNACLTLSGRLTASVSNTWLLPCWWALLGVYFESHHVRMFAFAQFLPVGSRPDCFCCCQFDPGISRHWRTV
jgi:hypothetical protein